MDEVSFASLDMKKFYTFTAVGLVGTRILLYLPMSIKTRLQVEQEQSVRALIRRHGVRQLYKGVGTVAFGIVPTQWLYLTALEVSKEKARFDGVLGFPVVERMMSNAFAGGVSSCASAVVGVPLDVVSQRMQLGEGSFSKVVSNVYRARGLRGFFQGYVASLIVYAPTSACWWMTYSNTRAILSEFSNGASNGAVGIGLSGAIAGCTSVRIQILFSLS
jgi:solute carrier family 25 protein 44